MITEGPHRGTSLRCALKRALAVHCLDHAGRPPAIDPSRVLPAVCVPKKHHTTTVEASPIHRLPSGNSRCQDSAAKNHPCVARQRAGLSLRVRPPALPPPWLLPKKSTCERRTRTGASGPQPPLVLRGRSDRGPAIGSRRPHAGLVRCCLPLEGFLTLPTCQRTFARPRVRHSRSVYPNSEDGCQSPPPSGPPPRPMPGACSRRTAARNGSICCFYISSPP